MLLTKYQNKKMKTITFQHKTSQKLYNNYIQRVKKQIAILPKEDRFDLLMEFNSHIYEGLQRDSNDLEIEKLINILDKLGNPEEVLKLTVADKILVKATKTFNPIHIFKALVLNISNGISFILFSLLYLLLLIFGFLIIQKILYPNEIGLFQKKGKFLVLGRTSDASVTEVLGDWFIPTMILCATILYFVITLALKLKQKIKS